MLNVGKGITLLEVSLLEADKDLGLLLLEEPLLLLSLPDHLQVFLDLLFLVACLLLQLFTLITLNTLLRNVISELNLHAFRCIQLIIGFIDLNLATGQYLPLLLE